MTGLALLARTPEGRDEIHQLADPSRLLDRDEAIEKLASVLPGLDEADLHRTLADPNRHFVWVRRGLTPRIAQQVHDLGLPGFAFRKELRRAYPLGALAGHLLGSVNADNKGVSGLERHIDDSVGIDPVHTTRPTGRPPVRRIRGRQVCVPAWGGQSSPGAPLHCRLLF